ncbi:MAG: hypothetical protein N2257_00100 [Thermodesulfovibrionales bacterium]|nr:hypothetical protein [Thermodesulfovibrionales bacterium]
MKEYLHQVIDIQSGRIRYDFAERLDRSKLNFRLEMIQRIEATIEGIETAIKKGMAERQKGEEEVENRKAILMEMADKIKDLEGRLEVIKKEVLS